MLTKRGSGSPDPGQGRPPALATVTGLAILLYRRITVTAVRQATTGNDKIMYTLLAVWPYTRLGTTHHHPPR